MNPSCATITSIVTYLSLELETVVDKIHTFMIPLKTTCVYESTIIDHWITAKEKIVPREIVLSWPHGWISNIKKITSKAHKKIYLTFWKTLQACNFFCIQSHTLSAWFGKGGGWSTFFSVVLEHPSYFFVTEC